MRGIRCRPSRNSPTKHNRTSVRVVDAACDDGKLSLLGVGTLTCTEGSEGRLRLTTRLITTEAACAPNAPTAAPAHSRRRGLSTAGPTAAIAAPPGEGPAQRA